MKPSESNENISAAVAASRLSELARWLKGTPSWTVTVWRCQWTEEAFDLQLSVGSKGPSQMEVADEVA